MKRSLCFFAIALAAFAGCRGGSGAPAGFTPVTPQMQPGAAQRATPALIVYPKQAGAIVSDLVLGANEATWNDITLPTIAPAFKLAGMHATRWPGGSESDEYHWKTNSVGAAPCNGGYVYPPSTFDNFVADVAKPANLDLALT